MFSSKNFVLVGKGFDLKTLLLQDLTQNSLAFSSTFFESHPAKQVFRSLTFPTWTKFGEQIAIKNKIFEFYLDDTDCKTYNKAAND